MPEFAAGPASCVGVAPPGPPLLRNEAEIVAGWQDEVPVVSVLCPTYQHLAFVRDSLQGFFGQRTTFPYEVVVRDDGSTDGTAEVVEEFARRYPRILRFIAEPENQYPDVDPLTPLIQASSGKFIAFCEGDDYWTDPLKLQKQIDALTGSGASVSHHSQVEVQDGRIIAATDVSGRHERDRSGHELRTSMKSLLTRTIVLERDVLLRNGGLADLRRMWAGDSLVTAMAGASGGSTYADVAPAVYRVHEGGVSTQLKSDPVVWLARKAMDAQVIGEYLTRCGFSADGDAYAALACARSTEAAVGLLLDTPRMLAARRTDRIAERWRATRTVLRYASTGGIGRGVLRALTHPLRTRLRGARTR